MGIDNLLRSLRQMVVVRNLSYYKGKKVAIDSYVW